MLAASTLLVLLAAASAGPGGVAPLPYTTTRATDLSTQSLQHHEVMRIRRDFGKPSFEIVVDSWVPSATPGRISDVRLWWVQNDANDRRSPFGKKVHKYVELQYTPHAADDWSVTLRADRKEFTFAVELDEHGHAQAYADIVKDDGSEIRHCRATEGRLVARRVVGIPIGIKRLELSCIDERGRTHEGAVAYRKLRNGPVYSG